MFNKYFKWGAATASAQIEGAYQAADRKPSVWDVASNYKYSKPIFNNHTTYIACDHYNKVEEDVKLMKEIGLNAYRFSISWSRLIPDGVGEVSKEGLKFYNKLIDELLKNGIEPYITVFHWDYPQSLLEKGGWLNPESTKWFEEYATKCVELFSDRVKNFMTLNEPECFINLGYIGKRQAPYYDLPHEVVFQMQHNVLLANGMAMNSMRKNAKQEIKIGVAFAQAGFIPASDKKEDIKAAYDAFFDNSGDEFWGNWFVNTILTGEYDNRKLAKFGDSISYNKEDMKIIKQKLDFIGINQYIGSYIRATEDGGHEFVDRVNTDYTAMDWPVASEGLYWTCKMLYEKYKTPLYITENGVALSEWPDLEGKIEDNSRIKYVHDHLVAANKAFEEGIEVKGYFYWSLMDNFEWSYGYAKRFGLIRVNFETGERMLKKSAYWYRDLIKKSLNK